MELVTLILALVVVGLVGGRLLREADRRREIPDDDEVVERVASLCTRLTGDPVRDRPTLNRILALGPGIIPSLLDALTQALARGEGFEPRRHARLEELVADFGLAAVPPVADALCRLQPSAPMTPTLLRILRRLGPPGAESLLRLGLDQPALASYLPRLRTAASSLPEPATTLARALRGRPAGKLARDLDRVAGLLADLPQTLDRLWPQWDADARGVALGWLCDWLPLARPIDVERGLSDPDPQVRAAGARLATLLVLPDRVEALTTLAQDADPRCRLAAVVALAAQRVATTRPALAVAVQDTHPDVAMRAAVELLDTDGTARWQDAAGLRAHPAAELVLRYAEALANSAPHPGVAAALTALDDPRPEVRFVATRILGRRAAGDPRARERLIRLTESENVADRASAVEALARSGDAVAADLLARALRGNPDRDALLSFQEAAQLLGEAAVTPLVRRVRAEDRERLPLVLATLRALPYANAVPALLRGLEDVRSAELEGHLAATIHVGGDITREAVHSALRLPARGLLPAALRYMAIYSTPNDVPFLLELFDRHLPLRSVILTLVEAQGAAARAALATRLDAGGDDAVVSALEHRAAILAACAEEHRAI